MRIKYIIFSAFIFMLGVQSCAPTKQVRYANKSLPEMYSNDNLDTLSVAKLNYETFFKDSKLIQLIDTALANNQELNIFMQQIALANNEIQVRKGEYLPFVNYNAGVEVEKVGEYTRNGSVEQNLSIREGEAFPEPLTNYTIGLSATWELDIWKKLRTSKKAAVMEYLATIEGRNFIVTNLVSEIAENYYELIALDNQLKIIDRNLELQNSALEVVKLQKQAAKATELAVKRFKAEVLKNKSERFEIKQKITESQNKLCFLIGKKPKSIDRSSEDFLNLEINSLTAGIPSQLLSNRPDIRQAEYELAAAKLNVKVARKSFYPSLGLRAGLGLEAFNPKFIIKTPESLLYGLTTDIVGPLINRRAIKAIYNNANAKQLQAVYEYEMTILKGFIEVENGLSNINNLKQNYINKNKEVLTLNQSIDIVGKLYQSARADYMEVLLTQRDALEAKIDLVKTKKEQLIANVNVYRALGGGWR